MKKKESTKRETPIVDGDGRPDMPVEVNRKKDKMKNGEAGEHKKFESERLSDVNSLEDLQRRQIADTGRPKRAWDFYC